MAKLFFLPFLPLCIHTSSILMIAYIYIIIRILMMVTLVYTDSFLSSFLSPSLFLFLSPRLSLSLQPPEEEGPRDLLQKTVVLSLSLSLSPIFGFRFRAWYSQKFVISCEVSDFGLGFQFRFPISCFRGFRFRISDFLYFRFRF